MSARGDLPSSFYLYELSFPLNSIKSGRHLPHSLGYFWHDHNQG